VTEAGWAPLELAGKASAACIAERRFVLVSGAGPETAIPVVRLRSGTPSNRAVLLLSGGPGESCLGELARGTYRALVADLVGHVDVIAFDQRGVGGALPGVPPVVRWDLPLWKAARRDEVVAVARARANSSREYWAARGLDLSQFTLEQSAQDVVALAKALHLTAFAIFGASYGSQLAQAVLALDDERIDRAVLCNVEGLTQTLKLPSFVEQALARAIGEAGVTKLGELVATLDERPARVDSAGIPTVGLSGFDLQRAVARWMGNREGLDRLRGGLQGESRSLLTAVAREVAQWRLGPFGGIQHLIDGTTHTTKRRLATIEFERHQAVLGDVADFPLPHVIEEWQLQSASAIQLRSSVPTLLVSGTHDCRTPLENLTEIRSQLSHARELVVAGGTHHLSDYLSHPPTRREVVEHLASDVA